MRDLLIFNFQYVYHRLEYVGNIFKHMCFVQKYRETLGEKITVPTVTTTLKNLKICKECKIVVVFEYSLVF